MGAETTPESERLSPELVVDYLAKAKADGAYPVSVICAASSGVIATTNMGVLIIDLERQQSVDTQTWLLFGLSAIGFYAARALSRYANQESLKAWPHLSGVAVVV